MKNIIGFIVCLCFIGCFCQCSDKNDVMLNNVENMMCEKPDSALILLQAIDKNTLNSERQKALYALLLSQALDKNYIDITNDSIISVAVDFFENSNETYYSMLAHYYNAIVASNDNNYADCIIQCMKAENIALKLNDNFYLGMIYRLFAYVNNKTFNHTDELNYCKLSYNHFCKTDKVDHTKYAYLDLASSYNNNKQFDKSIIILEDIINNPIYKNDTSFICETLSNYAHVQWLLDNYNQSLNAINTITVKYKHPLNALDYAHLSQLYSLKGNIDSTKYYIEKAIPLAKSTVEKSTIENAIYRINKYNGDYKAAIESKIRTNKIQDTVNIIVWKQSVTKIQRDYFNQNAKLADAKANSNKLLAITITIVAFLLIIIGLLFYNHYRIKQQIKIDNLKNLYSKLDSKHKIELSEIQDKINKLEFELKNATDITSQQKNELIKQQQELILLREQSKLNDINSKIINNYINGNEIIINLRNKANQNKIAHPQELKELDKFINSQFPNFKFSLFSLLKLSEIQYNVCLLIKADIKTNEIATLLSRDKATISNIKTRLFKKIIIQDSNITNLNDLINTL